MTFVLPTQTWGYRHHQAKVKYQEYSQQAFDLAREKNKPIFLVLSASWCFWCKKYDEDTLNTDQVSAYLNENFVTIFVDLDRRPDLGHLFVKRAQPTSVIFTPDGREFLSFSGTLKADEFMSGIRKVLLDLQARNGVPYGNKAATVGNVRAFLNGAGVAPTTKSGKPGWDELAREQQQAFLQLIRESVDEEQGGFGRSKKFPLSNLLQYLMDKENRKSDSELMAHAVLALNKIARHLYDPVEGGFFRYTDRRNWSRARHEKLITSNINLIRTFQMAGQAVPVERQPKGKLRYRNIYDKSLRFFLDTYRREGGGFYGSLDGRTPGYYNQSAAGRKKAQKPQLDKTLYTSWNAETVYVLTEIYRNDRSPELLEAIHATLGFLKTSLYSPAGGFRGFLIPATGKVEGSGQLVDNSWGAMAFIAGYQLSGRAEYRQVFEEVIAYAKSHLYIPSLGAFRLWNVPAHPGLREEERVSREIPLETNGVMAYALMKGFRATGNPEYLALAKNLVSSINRVDPEIFDENPNDPVKSYLESFVYFYRAQFQLARLGS